MEASLSCPVGEQLQPVLLSPGEFRREAAKLSGLNETSGVVEGPGLELGPGLQARVLAVANVAPVEALGEEAMGWAGLSKSAGSLLLVALSPAPAPAALRLVVHCDKLVIGSMLFKALKATLPS